jgi:hypothetical protein
MLAGYSGAEDVKTKGVEARGGVPKGSGKSPPKSFGSSASVKSGGSYGSKSGSYGQGGSYSG